MVCLQIQSGSDQLKAEVIYTYKHKTGGQEVIRVAAPDMQHVIRDS